jgi:hypothetical protein
VTKEERFDVATGSRLLKGKDGAFIFTSSEICGSGISAGTGARAGTGGGTTASLLVLETGLVEDAAWTLDFARIAELDV